MIGQLKTPSPGLDLPIGAKRGEKRGEKGGEGRRRRKKKEERGEKKKEGQKNARWIPNSNKGTIAKF